MVDSPTVYNVVAFSGSLREKSTNKGTLEAVAAKATGFRLDIVDIGDIPLYSGDIESKGIPDSVLALGEKIKAADGVYLGVPEYNYGMSAAMKNALDWISRIPGSILSKKPIALISAAGSQGGGARAQYDVRKAMVHCDGYVMNKPEVMIGSNW